MGRHLFFSLAAWAMALAGTEAQVSADAPGWFPFVTSPLDTPGDSPVDLSGLNRPGTQGRISVAGARFVDPKGERVRFLGTNVTFSAAFPDKAHAPALARRLAQLGFNVVRFHHLDARDIWKSPAQDGFDPVKLDRMDHFIAELKKNGVYVNMNLHVSRTYPGLEEEDLDRAFRYGKLLDKFHEPYIALQERYATDLLDRVNPHTGLSLLEDPAIAFVELNNENSLLQLRPELIPELAPAHREDLQGKWGRWLREREASPEKLLTRWNEGIVPLRGEMLENVRFEKGLEGWSFQKMGEAEAVSEAVSEAGGPAGGGTAGGTTALHLTMKEKGGVSWAYQLHRTPIAARDGSDCTLTLRARSDRPRSLSCHLRFAVDPWTGVSTTANFRLSPEWKTYSAVLRVDGVKPGVPVRLSLNFGDEPGEAWVTDLSLREGRKLFEVPPGVALTDFPLPGPETPAAGLQDFRRFLIDTERAYVARMRAHLEKMGSQALVIDTQASYGGCWGLHREATGGDFVDMHAYWQHPHFPRKPWDAKDWTIANTSMVAAADGGTFARLAGYRFEGKPYTVSEYNHPTPNDHAAEMFPMLASFAAYQDWDGIYQFCYGNEGERLREERITGYFNLARQSAQLVFAPVAALIFREGLVEPAAGSFPLTLPEEAMDAALKDGFPELRTWFDAERLPPAALLNRRFSIRFAGRGAAPSVPEFAPPLGRLMGGGGGAIEWTTEPAVYTVHSPAARVAVGEIGGGAGLDLGDVSFRIGLPERAWACAALAALDAKPVAESRRLLLAVATRVENTGMVWNEARTTVGSQWGGAPVVAEGVPGTVALPGGPVQAWALDPAGRKARRIERTDGNRIEIGPEYRTLWYAIERK